MNQLLKPILNWITIHSNKIIIGIIILVLIIIVKTFSSHSDTHQINDEYIRLRTTYIDSVVFYKNKIADTVKKVKLQNKREIDSLKTKLKEVR